MYCLFLVWDAEATITEEKREVGNVIDIIPNTLTKPSVAAPSKNLNIISFFFK